MASLSIRSCSRSKSHSVINLTRATRTAPCLEPRHLLLSFRPRRHGGSDRRSFWSSSSTTAATAAANTFTSSSNSVLSSIDPIPSVATDLYPLLLAVLLSTLDEEDDHRPVNPPWTVESSTVPGAGLAAYSTRSLRLGELLISERPLCIWPQGLSRDQAHDLFQRLNPNQQKIYLSLAGQASSSADSDGPDDRIRAIRATNGFGIELPDSNGKIVGMVFPKIARINHSCLPNAAQAMNFKSLRMEVYPITSIESGSEICIEYLPLVTKTRSERQIALKQAFGFSTCLCRLCTASEERIQASDQRRLEMKALAQEIQNASTTTTNRGLVLDRLERIRTLLKEEGYEAMPEFEHHLSAVSNAYAAYRTIKSRQGQS